MKNAIGCDYGALELKNAVIAHLTKQGYKIVNFGTERSHNKRHQRRIDKVTALEND